MTSRLASLVVTIFTLGLGAGCATAGTGAVPATPGASTASSSSQEWEKVVIADGVEIRVSEDAGPEARRVVEMIRSEMRSRYISAR